MPIVVVIMLVFHVWSGNVEYVAVNISVVSSYATYGVVLEGDISVENPVSGCVTGQFISHQALVLGINVKVSPSTDR